jgi:hypothetical protein
MTDSPAPHTPRSEVLPGEEVKDDLGEVVERVTQIGLTLGSGGRYTILPNSAFHADLRTLLSALSKAQEERDANGRLLAAATKRLSDYTKDHVAAGAALTSLRAEVVKVAPVVREALSIAAGWASRKPDSGNAQDKIRAGLDALRSLTAHVRDQEGSPRPKKDEL